MTKNENCIGSYNVNSYTRKDGTNVSGYIRTCSAIHSSNDSILDSEHKKLQNRADLLYSTMSAKTKNIITGGAADTKIAELNENIQIDNSKLSDTTRQRAVNFIIKHEGYRENAYKPTKDDVWTIGYGHTKGVKENDKITKEQAIKYLFEDFQNHSTPLNQVTVPLTENQKIALSSFIYNEDPRAFKTSTLLKKLNKGDIQGAADEFDRWIYKNKRVLKGLVNRRKSEKDEIQIILLSNL